MFGSPNFFIGKVVNRDDPTKVGNLQIRAMGYHDDTTNIPDADLPWAKVLMNGTSSSLGQVGTSPTGAQVGSTVVGVFLDEDHQNLLVLGTVHGANSSGGSTTGTGGSAAAAPAREHDVDANARGEGDETYKSGISPGQEPTEYEPTKAAAPTYPYNKTFRTESGHVVEYDDTPGKERIRTYHKSGTYTEITNEGVVTKTVGSKHEVVTTGSTIMVKGDARVQVNGNMSANVGGNMSANVAGNMTQTVVGTTDLKSTGAMTIDAKAGMNIKTAGTLNVSAAAINFNKN